MDWIRLLHALGFNGALDFSAIWAFLIAHQDSSLLRALATLFYSDQHFHRFVCHAITGVPGC